MTIEKYFVTENENPYQFDNADNLSAYDTIAEAVESARSLGRGHYIAVLWEDSNGQRDRASHFLDASGTSHWTIEEIANVIESRRMQKANFE